MDTRPTVVNIHHTPDFGSLPGDVYIGRRAGRWPQSEWNNPFRMTDWTDAERARVLRMYESHLSLRLAEGSLDLSKLVGARRLGCWCAPRRCHGDVLVERMVMEGLI